MPQLRVALAQINPTVGDIDGNRARAIDWCQKAADSACHVVALPEMWLTGYPIEDLALRESFQRASEKAVEHLALDLVDAGLGDLVVVVGHLARTQVEVKLGVPAGAPVNAASVLHQGKVIADYAKHHLPNYGVFDEFRYFVPGNKPCVIRVCGVDIALAICEDLWQDGGPVARVAQHGAGLLVVINGSPFELDKEDARAELVSRRAREAGAAIAYVNMVGGQDELVFDGDSMVVDSQGNTIARAPQFEEGLLMVDLDLPAAPASPVLRDGTPVTVISEWPAKTYRPMQSRIAPRLEDVAAQYQALVVGLRDYCVKNKFKSVALGLSGGIDSALVATIAADALGASNVYGVSMPSVYSSDHSKSDAEDLAQRLGLHYRTVAIAPFVDAYESSLSLTGLAAENLQARARGVTLMAISNQEGHLVLATGNKSELAVGYSTIYGDAVGGFAPIKDLPKTLVWEMSRWRNGVAIGRGEVPPIPESSIEKEPSAELRPGQKDSDSLPDYAILDSLLDAYVEHDLGHDALVAAGFERALVDRVLMMVDRAEYKRRQYPPGTKISHRAFGRDRRLPITNRWSEPTLS
jgi:NAD+ synthase (glutamine-hydrolysing)